MNIVFILYKYRNFGGKAVRGLNIFNFNYQRYKEGHSHWHQLYKIVYQLSYNKFICYSVRNDVTTLNIFEYLLLSCFGAYY